jgi:hypothetical protein
VLVKVPLAEGVRGRDIKVKCGSKQLAVTISGEGTIDGTLFEKVIADDMLWEVGESPGRRPLSSFCSAHADRSGCEQGGPLAKQRLTATLPPSGGRGRGEGRREGAHDHHAQVEPHSGEYALAARLHRPP